jgi:glycosyltransferase involved in cell wall biosynthesis
VTKVSVIVPNFNHARYLKQRLDSILQQTYTDFEVILLDDASTDESVVIMDAYTDPRITKRLYADKNSGSPFVQWERGVREASGDWIWIAESDDYSDPLFLERLLPVVQNDPSSVLAFCRSTIVTGEESRLARFESDHGQWHADADFKASGKEFCAELLYKGNVLLNAGAVLFRKSAFLKIIDDVARLRMSTDWLIWWKIALEGVVHYIAEPLNFFRRDGENVSTNWQQERIAVNRYLSANWPWTSANKSQMALEKQLYDLLVNKNWKTAREELSKSTFPIKRRVLLRFIKFKARL